MIQNEIIKVSPVQQQDYTQWLEYWVAYQNFYQVNLPLHITKMTWDRFFDEKEPIYCAVAKNKQGILGFVTYMFHRSTWAENNYCYLEDLYVSPEVRGRHIGKQLIEYVQKQATQHSCERLYWHTQESNQKAQKLYDWIAQKPGIIQYRMSLN
ncbi:GNAT family N-acetyltransferase [Acinetobacter nosocomialis]|uniref:GNAT family N-acetyltransferase n=1 Tax=Acinetobacter nosocomialis TaxID=106654 RepID=UPI001FD805AA|nr:GNAT family N-acetyltransferase [Acinetobacter nosocomialis]